MKKRKTLPNDFAELLKNADIEGLKAVFLKCEINAINGRYGSNAFEMGPLPREFAFWLKEQGGDVNQPDYYGKAPIFNHASAYYGDVALLLELGADAGAEAKDKTTPLHTASMYGRTDAVKALLLHGAKVNARINDAIFGRHDTPLEITLRQNRISKDTLLNVCNLLIDAGAEITDTAKELVTEIGKNFEYHKSRNVGNESIMESFAKEEPSMTCLYQLFSVPSVAPVLLEIHDGVSPIIVEAAGTNKTFAKLWDYLVPPNGRAKTAQGEVIRIVGKVCREILHNGGINWDGDFQKMLCVLPDYLQMGNPLPEADLAKTQKIIHTIYNGNGDICDELTPLAVQWVLLNPSVMPVIPPTYTR